MILTSLPVLAFLAAAAAQAAPAPSSNPLQANLPYATYEGFHNATSDLNVWLGVRYAAAPIGDLRWAAPQAPSIPSDGIPTVSANALPNQCPQNIANFSEAGDDEDCLFLNIYSPPNAKNFPVLVWIHGGGWDHNSAKEFDPTPMINLANNSFVAVIIQYRLGLFGFLAGSDEIRQDWGLNAGIKDARFSLQWVQSYIHLFGGCKDKVTIWGQSSGGGTILQLVTQESLQPHPPGSTPLFQASVLSSPWSPPLGTCADQFFVDQFNNLTTAANCTSLSCLRTIDTDVLKGINHQLDVPIPASHRLNYWMACIEGEGTGSFIKQNFMQSIASGQVFGKATLTGSNAQDGTGTTPSNLSTNALWTSFLLAHWPLTTDDITEINTLYDPADFPGDTTGHQRGTILYQDAVFTCSAKLLANAFNQGAQSKTGGWRYLFGIPPANHAQDNAFEFPIWYAHLAPTSSSFFASYTGEITSFIRFGNPNQAKPPLSDSLNWPVSTSATKAFNLTSTNEVTTYLIADGDASDVLTGTDERCNFWQKIRIRDGW